LNKLFNNDVPHKWPPILMLISELKPSP